MARRTPTATVSMRRPEQPITRTMLVEACGPLLDLVNVHIDDVESLTITRTRVRMVLVPRTKAGRKNLDMALRVSFPVWPDSEDGDQ